VELGLSDNGQRRRVTVGDEISIRLAENPSTGFRWLEPQYDRGSLEYLGSEYEPGGTRPGAAGTRVVRFRAVTPGRASVRLRNDRPTVPHSPGSSEYEVALDISVRS